MPPYHYENTNAVRFITFSCYHHFCLLSSENEKLIFINSLSKAREKFRFKLHGYAVMPDHVHLLIHPPENTHIVTIISEIKSRSAFEILQKWKVGNHPNLEKLRVVRGGRSRYAFWQRSFYDYNCRDYDKIKEKIDYCHANPIRKGLAASIEDYRWTSYRWYHGQGDYPIEIDAFEY